MLIRSGLSDGLSGLGRRFGLGHGLSHLGLCRCLGLGHWLSRYRLGHWLSWLGLSYLGLGHCLGLGHRRLGCHLRLDRILRRRALRRRRRRSAYGRTTCRARAQTLGQFVTA